MTQELGVYTYACPTPEDFSPEVYQPILPETQLYLQDLYLESDKVTKIVDDLQKQIDELTKQNDIFMGALKYCIAKFSREEIDNDWQLGMIEKACQIDEGEVK